MNGETFDSFMWELAFESARLAARPNLPSRMACVFACESVVDAKAFRDLCRAKARIHSVEIVDPTCPVHRGDYSLITHTKRSTPYLEYMPSEAVRYWTTPPNGMIEVLVGGSVRVVDVVAEEMAGAADSTSIRSATPLSLSTNT